MVNWTKTERYGRNADSVLGQPHRTFLWVGSERRAQPARDICSHRCGVSWRREESLLSHEELEALAQQDLRRNFACDFPVSMKKMGEVLFCFSGGRSIWVIPQEMRKGWFEIWLNYKKDLNKYVHPFFSLLAVCRMQAFPEPITELLMLCIAVP